MDGSLGGGGVVGLVSGFYLFSDPVIQFPRLGWQISNWDVKTPTSHRPVIYWIFWWKSINYVWSLKFVILVVTIKGISQQFKNHLSLNCLIEVRLSHKKELHPLTVRSHNSSWGVMSIDKVVIFPDLTIIW